MKWLVRGGVAIGACTVVFLGAVFLTITKDQGPGPNPAGYQTHSISVPHRNVALDVFVWYPTDEQIETQLVGQNALFYGQHVRIDAAPRKFDHPIVLISHGSGGNALQSSWLAEALVKLGYVVIAANHAGTTSRDSYPERTVMIWERARDLARLLDWAETNPIEGLLMNAQMSGVIGFSLGGASALSVSGVRLSKTSFIDYCNSNAGLWDCGWLTDGGVDFSQIDTGLYEASYTDNRIAATIAIDPALTQAVTKDSAINIHHPVLIVNFKPETGIPEAVRAADLATDIPDSLYHVVPKSWHFSFLSECSLMGKLVIGFSSEDNICSDSGVRNRGKIHREIIKTITSFLEQALPIQQTN